MLLAVLRGPLFVQMLTVGEGGEGDGAGIKSVSLSVRSWAWTRYCSMKL